MVKASELRSGNCVNSLTLGSSMFGWFKEDGITITPLGIHAIDCELLEVLPIPLTPEILEQCGFTLSEGKAHYTDGYHYFDFAFDNGMLVYLSPHTEVRIGHYCKHLHELQNLFYALRREELVYQPIKERGFEISPAT